MSGLRPPWGDPRYLANRRALGRRPGSPRLSSGGGGYDGLLSARDRGRIFMPGARPDTSPDAALLPDLPDLRAACHALMRNAPIARGAINTKATSVVGAGVVPQSQVNRATLKRRLGVSDEWCDDVDTLLDTVFEDWAGSEDSDLARERTFYERQDLAYRGAKVDGDGFEVVTWRDRGPRRLGTTLRWVSGARVANREPFQRDTPELTAGIRRDPDGAATTILIHPRFPGDPEWRSDDVIEMPIRAADGLRQVLHVYRGLADGQSRGEPDLAPVLAFLRTLNSYTNSEVEAADVASRFTVFVKTLSGPAPTAKPLLSTDDPRDDWNGDIALGPGAILGLAPNQDIVTADPKRPNTAFDAFVMSILRQIGVALELPFELLIKHFTASYSASRGAIEIAWAYFNAERAWFVRRHSRPIRARVLIEAAALGLIDLPGFLMDAELRAAYLGASWVGPPKPQIDEEREVSAAQARVAARFSTRQAETARMNGGDWNNVNARLRREEAEIAAPRGASAPPSLSPREARDRDDSDMETS